MTMPSPAQSHISVTQAPYHGWQNAWKISNGTVELIVTADVGPRIIFFGFMGGENEFHEFTGQVGQTGGNQWKSYGGHRLWVGPETQKSYYPDNVPIKAVRDGNVVRFIGPIENEGPLATGLQREMDIRLAPSGTHVVVTHKIANHGKHPVEMAPWAISVMEQNGRAILPLPPKAAHGPAHWPPESALALWSYTDFSDARWVWGRKYIQLKQEPHPQGALYDAQKVGLWDTGGWGAYYRAGHLFVNKTEVNPTAHYPDFNSNFEIYTDPGFLELETLGPLRNLQPNSTAVHVEQWWLYKDVPPGEDDAWIDSALMPRINRSQ